MSFADSEDEIDIELRQPAAVAARAVVLAAVLRRLALEDAIDATGEAESETFDLREWLREEHLVAHLTAEETALLATPLGAVDPDQRADFAWQGEGLAMLCWALGKGPLAPPGDPPDLALVLSTMPAPWERTAVVIGDARLRAEEEIAQERERADLWYWRATVESLRREANPGERQEYDTLIHEVVAESVAADIIPRHHSGDFLIASQPVRDLPPDALAGLIAGSAERLRALNWLCGFGDSWDRVPLDV